MDDAPRYAFPHAAEDESRRLELFERRLDLLARHPLLGLVDVGADAEADIIQPGTPLAEFYGLSMAAIGPPAIAAGALMSERRTRSSNGPPAGLPRMRLRPHRRVGPPTDLLGAHPTAHT